MPSRRRFLAASAGTLAALAGCTNRGSSPTPSDSPSDTDVPTPDDDARPTQTPRDPTPLDIGGAWPQEGGGPGHGGVTSSSGVPTDGEAYWHLRRVRSGPPVFADGRLLHFGLASVDESGTPTLTQTPPTGTSQPLDGEKALFCRDASTGRLQWTRPLDYRSGWPTVAGAHVLAAGGGFVAAYRIEDGTEVWRRDLGEREAAVSTAIDGTALVASEYVREGSRKPDVRAYDVEDGTRRWKRPSPEQQADLAAAGDTAFALSSTFQERSVLTARALSDGRVTWSVDIDGNGLGHGPIVAGDTVYVAPDDQGVYAYAVADGTERWHREGETANVVGLAAGADTAYLVDRGTAYAVDTADGREQWSVGEGLEHGYGGVPAVGSDAVYLQKEGYPRSFVALSRADGSERWTRTLPETTVEGDMVMSGLAAQPAVGDGGVYAYAQDGLYAFGPA
ncbi:PQQ-binding-like beta-propeller repeat protein [Halorarius halobius]|uniref:outer membrane protein assembly factor BamB family protein n=1 Tax=Halorarius halobius TaxID=2962671 RepID=UPI0020CD38DC|nr:PQQ-binding-like beta-propeller repeat protein [Halorarius halobius]